MGRPDFAARLMQLDRVRRRIPDVACRGLCVESCGPIATPLVEQKLIEGRVGDRLPVVHLQIGGPGGMNCWYDFATQACPLLRDGRCSIYDHRPVICRLWGATEGLECPHGCRPASGRLLTKPEADAILADVHRISEGLTR